MFTTRQTLRAFFSCAFVSLLLASIVAGQDKPSSELGSVGPAALQILNLNPLARPAPEKTSAAQGGLFDFTLPRIMKPVGLTPPSDRGESLMSEAGAGSASGALRLTLDEALARAVATNALIASSAGVSAAHYHHTAYQYDWNMLPLGQQLWLEHHLKYKTYPPLQAPEPYNLSQVLEQVKEGESPGGL